MKNSAEVANEAGMVMVLNILQCRLLDRIALVANLFGIAHETESKAEICHFVLLLMGHPFGRTQGLILPSAITVCALQDLPRTF